MRYQIFIPKTVTPDPTPADALRSVGLDVLADGCDSQNCVKGPDGQPGRVFAWLSPDALQLGYQPERQTWIPSAKRGDRKAGAYYVGFWDDSPVSEKELRKPDHGIGEWIPMGNGESWIVTNEHNIGRIPAFGDDGKLVLRADPAFAWYTMELRRRRESIVWDEEKTRPLLIDTDIEADFEFLTRVLQLNYRIIPEVIVHLGLLPEQTLMKIAFSFVGLRPGSATRYGLETEDPQKETNECLNTA